MMRFKDIKTGNQLLIGFGIIIAMLVVLSIVASRQTNKLALQTENLFNHPLQVRRAVGKFETSITAMHRDLNSLLLADNDKEIENLLVQIAYHEADANQHLNVMESQYLGPISDIQNLSTEFMCWNTIQKETIRILRQGNFNEAKARTKPNGIGGVQAKRMYDQLFKVDEFAKNKANQFYSQSVQLKTKLKRQFLLFAISIILASSFLAGYLSRLINKPMKEIALAMDSYRSGNKTARSGYSSNNQFGKLSATFNQMAEAIEIEHQISSRAADLSGVLLSEKDAINFCNNLLKNLLEHTNSHMGAVYLLNDSQTLFEPFTCLGMDTQSCKPFSATRPEGEFGLALSAKKINHVSDIPFNSRFAFHTVSGSIKPREIITIPIFNHNNAEAVISIFSIHNYSEISLRLIESIFDTLTARMNGILTYKKIVEFSEKLEEQNRELDAQKKELETLTDELKEQNTELEVQKNQLGEVSRLKTNFLSSMSHELRTPLNSVIALSNVLNRRLADKIGDEEYSFIDVIERNGKHLLNLINDILDLSRIEAGKIELEKNRFNINALLNEVISMIKPQADQKSVNLIFTGENKIATIETDYKKCFHIFQNIIANAVKFTEEGSVEISVSAQKEHVIIKISDTGIGINKADLPYIFDEFRQADGSSSRKFGGTGLGLSIAKKYGELLSYSISVVSELGKGSVFTVSIPVKARYSTQEMMSIPSEIIQQLPQSATLTIGEGKHILLVEDTEAMTVQIRDILEVEGYSVDTAKTGFEALDLLEKNIPDVIILDIMMPGMDGFELLRKIRGNKLTSELPVLVLTAKILDNQELKVIQNYQAHQLIQKGRVTHESLLEAIAVMMLKKEEYAGMKQAKISPVNVTGKPVVLAFEDNADNMIALKALIGDQVRFIEAVNGAEGIEKAQNHLPHLILMDIAMPGMNGFEALKVIRTNETLKHIPVIVVTSSAMSGDKNYFLDYGFNGYVSKPIDGKLLIGEMHKWVKSEIFSV